MEKYQLVLQFDAKSLKDFDRLTAFEGKLAAHLGGLADVDGHDFGSDELNIFLFTDQPLVASEKAHAFLKTQEVPNYMRAAYREVSGEEYVILWPSNLTHFQIS
jgi:hypothetical protein